MCNLTFREVASTTGEKWPLNILKNYNADPT